MEFVYHGHATLSIIHPQGAVLVDPFLTGNPLLSDVDLDSIVVTDLLLTHGHEDHVLDAPHFARREGVQTIAPFEVANWVSKQGGANVMGMNPGGTVAISGGRARMVNAIHSSTLPDGTPGGQPAGFVIELDGKRLYHAGDTALTLDMELIGRYWPCDWAALPIGDVFTMGWRDAIAAASMCKAREVIGLHYDTFPPIALSDADKREARAAFESAGITLHLLSPGEKLIWS